MGDYKEVPISDGAAVPAPGGSNLAQACRVNKSLVPLKGLMFLIHGGISALLPFMAIHMKSLGISVKEAAIILTVLPFVSAIGPPLGGTIADKIGNYKLVFILAVLSSVALHLLLYFVTPAYLPYGAPILLNAREEFNMSTLTFGCNASEAVMYKDSVGRFCPNVTSYDDVGFMDEFDAQKMNLDQCSSTCPSGFGNNMSSVCQAGKSAMHACRDQLASYCNSTQRNACRVLCSVSGRKQGSSTWKCPVPRYPPTPNVTHNWAATLGIYSAFRLTSTTLMWMAVPLLDALAVTMCQEHKADLGFQKMFSQIGFSLAPPLSGLLIAYASKMNGFEDYGPAFYIFSAMHILACVVVMFVTMNLRIPAESLFKNIKVVMADRRVISMTIVVLVCGCGFGFLTSFLFWFLEEDLHAGKPLLGWTQTVCGLAGMPAMALATVLIRKVGHTPLFVAGLLAYSLRFLAMSFLPVGQAYWVLPLQLLEGITHSLVVVNAAHYAGTLSPTYVASLQGIVFAAHYCIGKGAGALFGGFLMDAYGSRWSFRIFSIAYFIIAILYYFGNLVFVTRHRRKNGDIAAKPNGVLPDKNGDVTPGPIYIGVSRDELDKLPYIDDEKEDDAYYGNIDDRQYGASLPGKTRPRVAAPVSVDHTVNGHLRGVEEAEHLMPEQRPLRIRQDNV